jgi:transcriptional regulator GlxA family with amidase domain
MADAGGLEFDQHLSGTGPLQADFPAVSVDADAIFVQADNLWTSAGVTAGIDLALALVEEDFGRELALDVATDMVVYLKRPGGQSQFSTHLLSDRTTRPSIRDIQKWILANLQVRTSVARLASRAMMSERHFARVFLQEVGMSVQEFIEACRFERATQLLADVRMPLKTVAAHAGFSAEAHMRRVFQQNSALRRAFTGSALRRPGSRQVQQKAGTFDSRTSRRVETTRVTKACRRLIRNAPRGPPAMPWRAQACPTPTAL